MNLLHGTSPFHIKSKLFCQLMCNMTILFCKIQLFFFIITNSFWDVGGVRLSVKTEQNTHSFFRKKDWKAKNKLRTKIVKLIFLLIVIQKVKLYIYMFLLSASWSWFICTGWRRHKVTSPQEVRRGTNWWNRGRGDNWDLWWRGGER
mgnify:CR=1 FL=1